MTLVLTDIPDYLAQRIRLMAAREHRSMDEQVVMLLEQALAERERSFSEAFEDFIGKHGTSLLDDSDLDNLRSTDPGRPTPSL